MSAINFHTREISVKIVYYGPGLCGKTTSLQTIFNSLPVDRRPDLVSLATEVDRTIFFDFLPVTAYRIKDFTVRLQLYTVPGQVFYNATRKLVLNGVDGLVMVLDSQDPMRDSNAESLQNLVENLHELGLELPQVPMVFQYNKRDLSPIMSATEMDRLYNGRQLQRFESVATTGQGVFEALKAISRMVVNDLMRKG
ncbi:MAG: ADP-ribosylation factor-like protein, partial [Myxococcota bacterium]